MLIAGVLATTVPVVGHAAAGLVGGFVAGYLAGGGLLSGFWHGLLAGSVSGIVVTLALAAFGGLVGLVGGPLGSLLGGAGVFVVVRSAAIYKRSAGAPEGCATTGTLLSYKITTGTALEPPPPQPVAYEALSTASRTAS
ncbi:hypothetical protein C473_14067 [Halorubrum distributum JCM 10247]|uniref:Uncharacterized protein n=1 Tax=Halorubrum distributum JCM 10247 TaxID=1227486 RepID=M0D4E4_9EURY|nr:hypothetical protein C473_14067 [Halorubrum terrestre JCM 10247]